jgi:GDP/UDP-N,N'-diacetylbacillosamine 2-epimerase (hydrolysing)
MREIKSDSELDLQIVVTGTHFSTKQGDTYQEIENDGWTIDRKIEFIFGEDTSINIADSIASVVSGCTRSFKELQPHIILVLGDRFEIFGAATAALISKIPIAHIHGGESTFGSYDEAFRHSITKMSQIHFVATETYGARVRQLGENPDNIHVVGGIGIDEIQDFQHLDISSIKQSLGIELFEKIFLVTFHPVTLDANSSSYQLEQLLRVLEDWKDTSIIFTAPNGDEGNLFLSEMITKFVRENSNAHFFRSLGRTLYLSLMAISDCVIGNSSSGIIEAPSLKVASIDIGLRQEGRVRASSVINCEAMESEIRVALKRIYSEEFQKEVKTTINPYGNGGSSQKIVKVLKSVSLENLMLKRFFDCLKDVKL